jgi:heptosyltransferase II
VIVVAPGAAYGTAKRWLPAHFARLVAMMASERGAQCVLVGSAGDAGTADWIKALLRGDHSLSSNESRLQVARGDVDPAIIDLTGATTLEMLAGVMAIAAACVSNDSGAMHLAGAVGVPLAALFGPTREHETAPLVRAGGRADVMINPVWCRPCMLRECPIDHRCMKGLSPERVFDGIDRLIGARGA